MKHLTIYQTEAIGELLAAEASYLTKFNWIPIAPIISGAKIYWIDPANQENDLAQDQAIEIQKRRVNDILYRNW